MLPGFNNPEKLVNICLEFLSQNVPLLYGAYLPREVGEELISIHANAGRMFDDTFAKVFVDASKTKLKRVFLKNALTKECLNVLLQHNLTHLDVSRCSIVPITLLRQISIHGGESLQELSIGSWKRIEHHPQGFEMAPNLKKLEICRWHDFGNCLTLSRLLEPLTHLESLDLSAAFGVKDISCLENLTNLKKLILYNITKTNLNEFDGLTTIKKLKKLTHLDISGIQDYEKPDDELYSIMANLPNLVYLDISETNLAGRGVANEMYSFRTDILGLTCRVDRPLDFLGLFDTKHEACQRRHIPAILISGDASEEQLIIAGRAYIDRPSILEKVLSEIYNLCRDDESFQTKSILGIILEAMERHQRHKMMQISGSATLFFIVKSPDKNPLATKVKRRIIRLLLNAMFRHREDHYMLRNGCLCLCQFKIPQDVMFEYERLVDILLYTATELVDAAFIQRIAIYLLNSLACQVDGKHKHILGDAGAVQKMLKLIENRLKSRTCDDVMEVAWSTLWNVTDETAVNCRHFLDGEGMDFFIQCLTAFPEKEELLRNMMGLLGNVAEVKELRPRLMTAPLLKVFTKLLLSISDGIEVSYNAAGVLAHICSDGEESWTISEPARFYVLQIMQVTMESWDLKAERNINYRSFEPILGLLKVAHTPQCQHWAAWALANLTKVYPNKYCKLVEAEGGLEILSCVANAPGEITRTKELAQIVIDNCQRFKDMNYDGVQLDG